MNRHHHKQICLSNHNYSLVKGKTGHDDNCQKANDAYKSLPCEGGGEGCQKLRKAKRGKKKHLPQFKTNVTLTSMSTLCFDNYQDHHLHQIKSNEKLSKRGR